MRCDVAWGNFYLVTYSVGFIRLGWSMDCDINSARNADVYLGFFVATLSQSGMCLQCIGDPLCHHLEGKRIISGLPIVIV